GQEERDRLFIHANQNAWIRIASLRGLAGQAQAGKPFRVEILKIEPTHSGPVQLAQQAGAACIQARGIAQSIQNWQVHRRQAGLHFERTIDELNHRMDNALRLHHHLYLLIGYAKEPVGLNHLQALIHQGRRIDSDLWSHTPGGMSESLLDRYRAKLVQRRAAERTAGGGDNQAAHVANLLAAQALPERAVLAIDRQDRDASAPGLLH